MKLSANEVMTLAARAARGAGAPPAQAVAFGRAVLFHLAADRPEGDLVAALDALPGGAILTLPLAFARILTAPSRQTGLPPDAPSCLLQSYAEAQPFATTLRTEGTQIQASADLESPGPAPTARRIAMSEDLYARLDHQAARILVPESETSRRAGAGAGLTDND